MFASSTCPMSCVICHISRVRCHVSHVTCHMSQVTCHYFYLFFSDKVVKLVGGGSVINGAYHVYLCKMEGVDWHIQLVLTNYVWGYSKMCLFDWILQVLTLLLCVNWLFNLRILYKRFVHQNSDTFQVNNSVLPKWVNFARGMGDFFLLFV